MRSKNRYFGEMRIDITSTLLQLPSRNVPQYLASLGASQPLYQVIGYDIGAGVNQADES